MYYQYLIAFTAAFLLSFVAVWPVKKLAYRQGVIDVPRDRGMHRKPVPLMGGIAVFASFCVVMTAAALLSLCGVSVFEPGPDFVALMAGCVIIEFIGVADDIMDLSYKIRMPVQVLAAVVVATFNRIGTITNPFSAAGFTVLPEWLSWIVTVLWIVGITNAMNLIDGLDGLSGGIAAITSLSTFVIALLSGDTMVAFLSAVLAGSVMGFLPHNIFPATIFIGDSGAPLLGFILATMSIKGAYKMTAAVSIAIPVFIMAVPLFDTVSSIVRRVAKGRSPVRADRQHLHHKLVDLGFSQKDAVLILYTICLAFGVVAVVLAAMGPVAAIIIFAVMTLVLGAGIIISYKHLERPDTAGAQDAEPDLSGHSVLFVTSDELVENVAVQIKACAEAEVLTMAFVVGDNAREAIEKADLSGEAAPLGWQRLKTVRRAAKEIGAEVIVISGEDRCAYEALRLFEDSSIPVAHLMRPRTRIRTPEQEYILARSADSIRTADIGETDEAEIGRHFLTYLRNNIFNKNN